MEGKLRIVVPAQSFYLIFRSRLANAMTYRYAEQTLDESNSKHRAGRKHLACQGIFDSFI